MYWFNLSHDRNQWHALVSTVLWVTTGTSGMLLWARYWVTTGTSGILLWARYCESRQEPVAFSCEHGTVSHDRNQWHSLVSTVLWVTTGTSGMLLWARYCESRQEPVACSCEHGTCNFGSHKRHISWLIEWLLASDEGGWHRVWECSVYLRWAVRSVWSDPWDNNIGKYAGNE